MLIGSFLRIYNRKDDVPKGISKKNLYRDEVNNGFVYFCPNPGKPYIIVLIVHMVLSVVEASLLFILHFSFFI